MKEQLSHLWQRMTARMDPVVFFGAAGVVVAFCVFGGFWTETASEVFLSLQQTVSNTLGWYYTLITTLFLALAFWLMLSPYGKIRLGPEDSRPEFGYFAWFAMLFSAGMGTGIVFWGVAEPMHHYLTPPHATPETAAAIEEAMRYTFFHWGLHPWAIYIVLGVALAYFHFRHHLPLAPRAILYPLIGKRMNGPLGVFVDILCTVGTLLGVATSLGLGAMQINAGLDQSLGLPQSVNMQIGIIALITLVATISVVSGIHGGIRRLSLINLSLAAILLLFVFVAGPTLIVLETFVGSLGNYLQNLPGMSLATNFTNPDNTWQASWTFFYWGWWISWSPFVGIFIARISKGRTVRDFIFWVLLVPTLGTFFWLSTFGGTAFEVERQAGELARFVQDNVALSLHALLDNLPLAGISTLWATVVIVIFFITSSDSGSLVDDMVTSGGHPNPARPQRVFWAVSEGAVAAILLLVGGLTAIQNASIAMGSLMSLVLIVACVSLLKAFRQEPI